MRFLTEAGHGPLKAGALTLLEKDPEALAISCTGDKTDVLKVKKLNAISSSGKNIYIFFA